MKILSLVISLALFGVVVGAPVIIRYNQFSSSPDLGRGQGTTTDPTAQNYGALTVFTKEAVPLYTGGSVEFVLDTRPLPFNTVANRTCTAVETVKQVPPSCSLNPPLNAAYDAGAAMNAVWGFIYNSVPFGMNFENVVRFYWQQNAAGDESGIELAQRLLNQKNQNLQVFPVLGGAQQSSGYFQANMNNNGLVVACTSGWVWRYLNPPGQIVNIACDNLVAQGIIPAKNITFINAVPGLSVLGGVQVGGITAFEFASAKDNFDAITGGFFPDILSNNPAASPTCGSVPFPLCLQNPGHKNLTFVHYPAWHQNLFSGWMLINQDFFFNNLTQSQRDQLFVAGKYAYERSFELSTSVECPITEEILNFNNGMVQLNPDGTPKDCNPSKPGVQTCSADMKIGTWNDLDLHRLKVATDQFLAANGLGSPDRDDYLEVLAFYQKFYSQVQPKGFEEGNFPFDCPFMKCRCKHCDKGCDKCHPCDESDF